MALEKFAHKEAVEVEWHSFELDPNTETRPEINATDYLAEIKGQSRDWAEQMQNQVTDIAAKVGLTFNLEEAKVANSFKAHRLIQLAKFNGLGDAAEEELFKAYFTDAQNIDDEAVLVTLGVRIGLEKIAVEELYKGYDFSNEVRADEQIAQQIGISGVPFFIIDEKLSVSGAQAPETFLGALEQAWSAKV